MGNVLFAPNWEYFTTGAGELWLLHNRPRSVVRWPIMHCARQCLHLYTPENISRYLKRWQPVSCVQHLAWSRKKSSHFGGTHVILYLPAAHSLCFMKKVASNNIKSRFENCLFFTRVISIQVLSKYRKQFWKFMLFMIWELCWHWGDVTLQLNITNTVCNARLVWILHPHNKICGEAFLATKVSFIHTPFRSKKSQSFSGVKVSKRRHKVWVPSFSFSV